jgi:hypothetical protein
MHSLVKASLLGLLATIMSCSSATPAVPGVDAGPKPLSLPALGLNDVSVLIPIPSSPAAPGNFAPTDTGARGELLPLAVYEAIPKFGVKPAQGLDYARMRAVAVRFDGCFAAPSEASGCAAQIRIVMQPITAKGATLDSSLHLFYRLTDDELSQVVRELRGLRKLAPELRDAPLDIIAALLAQGMEGPYGVGLHDLVLKYAGEQNLVRMTFFLRAPPAVEEWFFGGFDRANGTLTQLAIVSIGKTNQRVDHPTDGIPEGGYQYDFIPAGKSPEDTRALQSSASAAAASPEALDAVLGAFARIENPSKYGPDQLPCAGCHVATFVTAHARTTLGKSTRTLPDAFTSKHDLSLKGEAETTASSLRAFGYFDKKPMISNRVVFESAAVVDDFENRFPAK